MSDPTLFPSDANETNNSANLMSHSGMLSYEIKDKTQLHAAYMPFIKRGGLFIPSDLPYTLGSEVLLSLQLLDEPARISIMGTVVWVTPIHAQSNRKQGIGLEFSNDDESTHLRNKIETYLAGALHSDRPTDTL